MKTKWLRGKEKNCLRSFLEKKKDKQMDSKNHLLSAKSSILFLLL